MNIPRYWAKETRAVVDPRGKRFLVSCWRWSESGASEAKLRAKEGIEGLTRKIREGRPLERYAYGSRALREEIVEEIGDGRGRVMAIITRNAYGALVLNTANVMFVDIDFPSRGCLAGLAAPLRRLLGLKTGDQETIAAAQVAAWARRHPAWGLRLYRTYAGLRALVTHDVLDPAAEGTRQILLSLGCDPMYIQLCRSQGSFRARLSPKPWRFNMAKPPVRYPRESGEEEYRHRQWLEGYERAADKYTVCRLMGELGSRELHPEARTVLAIHDRHAVRGEGRPLA